MIKQTLKNGKCSKCGSEQDFLVVEGIDFESEKDNAFIDFSSYSAFKNPCVNVCENCGYINFDLTENLENFAVFDKNHTNQSENVIAIDSIFQKYFENSPFNLKAIQVLAKIFSLHQFSFKSFLSDNFRKNYKNENNLVSLHNVLMDKFCEACKLFMQTVNSENNFVKCFYVELLATNKKPNKAREILNTLNIADDLKDYLLECIELGGDE